MVDPMERQMRIDEIEGIGPANGAKLSGARIKRLFGGS
jgi:hypothetical protein